MIRYQNRIEYHKWFSLFKKHHWLKDCPGPLDDLAKMCGNPEEVDLVCNLISKLHYVTSDERRKCLSEIVHQIIHRWELRPSETVIVATTTDNEADSAQYIAQCLKPILQRNNWTDTRVINNFGKCCQLDCVSKYKSIVFVDEFIGSGTTIVNRIDRFAKNVEEFYKAGRISFRDHSIKVCVLACMEHAKPQIEDFGVELFASIWLKKGIAGYYSKEERFGAYRTILSLERKLDRSKDNNDIFPCGYKKSEALYAMEEGNAVNNLFPIFWWPYAIEKRIRQTLFDRKEM